MIKPTFSLYHNGIKNTMPNGEIDIKRFLELLKEDNFLIKEIRNCKDKEERNKLKSKLSYVTFGGTFEKRGKDKLKKSSGLVCLDYDDVEDLNKTKQELIKNKYTHCLFISPSGNGLKLIVKIPEVKNDDEYKGYWLSIAKHYRVEETDESTKDISRACYLSIDENPYFNPNSEIYTEKVKDISVTLNKTGSKDGKDTSKSGEEMRIIIKLIKKGKTEEEVFEEMKIYAKWASSPDQYKEMTYNKALNWCLNHPTKAEVKKTEKRNSIEGGDIWGKKKQAKIFIEKNPLYYDENGVWWVWNKENYCYEDTNVLHILNSIAKSYPMIETINSKERTEIIAALQQVGITKKPKDILPSWVQFKNKIYDIKTGEEFEATPEYFIANPIPWDVGESEDTPTIDKLFNTWVSKEDVPKIYELIAFSTVPEMFIHSFHFLYSPPGMGKGTYVNILLNFIGRNNSVSTSMSRINANPRFETRWWNKKLLITMAEVSNVNELKNSGLINQATGGDPLRAEVKGSPTGFDFVNYGKFIYPTNKLLKVDPEDGFGRRVRTIKFKTRFEKEKDVLSEIPDVEYENLAKKSLRIAKDLYKERRFTGDVDISERMSNYQEESKTPLERFIDKYCDTENFEDKVLLDEFFSKYSNYLKKNGGRQINKSNLGRELKKLGWETKREYMPSTQNNLDGTIKKDYKMFILGIKYTGNTLNTPISHIEPHIEVNRDVPVLPVLPVYPKEIGLSDEEFEALKEDFKG